MPLQIRDGNQSLTTLSTLIVNSAHVPAHTVVSLGSQAITDIAQAVSGVELGPNSISALEHISVTISAGTSITVGNVVSVTGGLTNAELRASSVTIGGSVQVSNLPATQTVTFSQASVTFGATTGSVSVLNFPSTQTVAGTVTANLSGTKSSDESGTQLPALPVQLVNLSEEIVGVPSNPLPISGTVTANSILVLEQPVYEHTGTGADRCILIGTANADGGQVLHTSPDNPMPISGSISGTVTVGNSVTIGSLPAISGTVTATIRNGEDAILNDGLSGYTVIRALSHWYDDVGNEIKNTSQSNPLPISGTVTVGASSVTFNSNVAKRPDGSWQPLSVESASNYVNARVYPSDTTPFLATVTVGGFAGNAVTTGYTFNGTAVSSLPVIVMENAFGNIGTVDVSSGSINVTNSVTISALPSGALTTRFGSVTTANTAQITSAVTNTSRKYLLAQNISAGTVTIGIGFSPTTTQGIQLTAGGGLTFDAFCPTGAVYWLGAVTGAAWTILEG